MTDTPRLTIVVGDTMVDVVAHLPHEPVQGTDTPAQIAYRGGGSAANVAAWLAHLATPVALVSRIGMDALGDSAADELQRIGVQCWLTRDPGSVTGTCIVLVSPDGERTMIPDVGANGRLSVDDLPERAFDADQHLHLSGYALLRQGSRAAARSALERALACGMTTSVDASSAAPMAETGSDLFLSWVAGVTIIFANADEARVLTGKSDASDAAADLARLCPLAIVKTGRGGAVAHDGQGRNWQAPADPVTAIDSTGAGDAFAAAFLSRWTTGAGVDEALAFAVEISGRAVGGVGGRP